MPTAFDVVVDGATVLDHLTHSLLEHSSPRKYYPYAKTDFPDLTGRVGAFLCRGSAALRVVGCNYTHAALFVDTTVYQSIEIVGVVETPWLQCRSRF
jgi:hypothetical protein